eukprot:GEMP01029945.1.p1 GENE.GEMP01029945.1~~GEMP01029945.1.p1  ORF type:complete len:298 (+),score=62.35 GEMP01029945.1:111-1004(+)
MSSAVASPKSVYGTIESDARTVHTKKSYATTTTLKSQKSEKTRETDTSKSSAKKDKKEKKEKKARKAAAEIAWKKDDKWNEDEWEWDDASYKWIRKNSPTSSPSTGIKSAPSSATVTSKAGKTKRIGKANTQPQGDLASVPSPTSTRTPDKIRTGAQAFTNDDYKHSVNNAVRSWLVKRRTEMSRASAVNPNATDDTDIDAIDLDDPTLDDQDATAPDPYISGGNSDADAVADTSANERGAGQQSMMALRKSRIIESINALTTRTKLLFKSSDKPGRETKETGGAKKSSPKPAASTT